MAALLSSTIACGGQSATQTPGVSVAPARGESGATPPSGPRVTFQTAQGPVTLKLEVARSLEDRTRGLMGRTYLEPGSGMVFVWETPTDTPFWMKDTLIPLSIAFIAADGAVIDIQDMEPLTLTRHFPPGPYLYAVEANKGFFEQNGVAEADRASFTGL